MNKKLFAIILSAALLLAFACGCSRAAQDTQTPAEEPSATVAPLPEVNETPEPAEGPEDSTAQPVGGESGAAQDSDEPKYDFPLVVDCGESFSIDLDGDGTQEDIVYTPAAPDEEFLPSTIHSLTINGQEFAESLYEDDFYTDLLVKEQFCITDIDSSDGMYELAIMDYGPSDDYKTCFFRWNGSELVYLGRIPGLICDPQTGEEELTFNPDGSITSYVRLSVLQTWYAPVAWKLTENGFELIEQELYYPDSRDLGMTLTVTSPVAVYSDNSTDSQRGLAQPGTVINIVATDNAEWVCANIDGGEVWLHLDPESPFKIELENDFSFAGTALDGLCLAD